MSLASKFSGVGEIVRYNWTQYLAGICAVTILMGLAVAAHSLELAWWYMVPLAAGAALALWWLLASLVASWWVYDLSGIRPYGWLRQMVKSPAGRWAYVHTGLDECGYKMRNEPGAGQGMILDTFDAGTMTEVSVRRARQITSVERRPDAECRWDAWPTKGNQLDTIYFIFAAHELRQAIDRENLFKEAARSLALSGQIVLVEHVRDWRNFLAYGPGFMHFWPEKEWDRLAAEAGLMISHRGRKAGFVITRVYENHTERTNNEQPGYHDTALWNIDVAAWIPSRVLSEAICVEGRTGPAVAAQSPDLHRPLHVHRSGAGAYGATLHFLC